MLAFKDFPKALDILAIARIESTYNERARNGISRGIMQVNKGPWDLSGNVQAGVNLLREYFLALGSAKAAVISYNIGIGNYKKGKRNPTYWSKFQGARNEISSFGSLFLDNVRSDTYEPGQLSGYSGGLLLQSDGTTHDDPVLERGSGEGWNRHQTPREIHEGLGKVKEDTKWDSSLPSSLDP